MLRGEAPKPTAGWLLVTWMCVGKMCRRRDSSRHFKTTSYRPEFKPTTFSAAGALYRLRHSCRDHTKSWEMRGSQGKDQSQLLQENMSYPGCTGAIKTGELSLLESSWFHLAVRASAGYFSKCASPSFKRETDSKKELRQPSRDEWTSGSTADSGQRPRWGDGSSELRSWCVPSGPIK